MRELSVWHIVPVPGMPEHPREHHFSELIYVTEGEYRVAVEGCPSACTAGSMCFYPPGTPHVPHESYRQPPRLFVAQWRGGPTEAPWDSPFVASDPHGRVLSALTWVWNTMPLAPDQRRRMHRHLWNACTSEIERSLLSPDEPTDPAHKAALLLRHKPEYRFNLEELGRHVGLSPWQLSRRFREAFGLPPMKYLKRLRLEKALNLIRTTQLPLKTIADRVGYSTGQHLSREIHRAFGRPPSELRTGSARPR
jgi:AraC-like DNA-binding protein